MLATVIAATVAVGAIWLAAGRGCATRAARAIIFIIDNGHRRRRGCVGGTFGFQCSLARFFFGLEACSFGGFLFGATIFFGATAFFIGIRPTRLFFAAACFFERGKAGLFGFAQQLCLKLLP
jgi:hypothetical protein